MLLKQDGEITPTSTLKPIHAKHESFHEDVQSTVYRSADHSPVCYGNKRSPRPPNVQKQNGETATTLPIPTSQTSTQQKIGKETRWADNYDKEPRSEEPVEILIDEDDEDTDSASATVSICPAFMRLLCHRNTVRICLLPHAHYSFLFFHSRHIHIVSLLRIFIIW